MERAWYSFLYLWLFIFKRNIMNNDEFFPQQSNIYSEDLQTVWYLPKAMVMSSLF